MTGTDFQSLIDWLNAYPEWILLCIGAFAFLESLALVGIVVPGVAILFVVATLAGSAEISIWAALSAGFIGAVLGDVMSFYVGHIYQSRLLNVWPFTRFPKALASGERFFEKHGGKSVVIGRFVGPIRPVLPIVAGMLGMRPARFVTINVLSAIAWAPFYILPGYWSGAAMTSDLPKDRLIILVSLLMAFALALLGFRWASQRLQQPQPLYQSLEQSLSSAPRWAMLWRFATRYQIKPIEFPLASLTLLLGATFFFWSWTLISLETGWLNALDQQLLTVSIELRSDGLDYVFSALTLLGNEAFLYCSFILLVGLLVWSRQIMLAFHVAAGGLLAAILTHGMKAWFVIPRPDIVLNAPASFAYPSGHSSGAAIFWGLLASVFAQDIAPLKRWQTYTICFIPMLLIAISRVYLGVHWFSDIIGGLALGLALCGLVRVSYSRYHSTPANLLSDQRTRTGAVLGLWLLAALAHHTWLIDTTVQSFGLKD